jgi:hypothetical protein
MLYSLLLYIWITFCINVTKNQTSCAEEEDKSTEDCSLVFYTLQVPHTTPDIRITHLSARTTLKSVFVNLGVAGSKLFSVFMFVIL